MNIALPRNLLIKNKRFFSGKLRAMLVVALAGTATLLPQTATAVWVWTAAGAHCHGTARACAIVLQAAGGSSNNGDSIDLFSGKLALVTPDHTVIRAPGIGYTDIVELRPGSFEARVIVANGQKVIFDKRILLDAFLVDLQHGTFNQLNKLVMPDVSP